MGGRRRPPWHNFPRALNTGLVYLRLVLHGKRHTKCWFCRREAHLILISPKREEHLAPPFFKNPLSPSVFCHIFFFFSDLCSVLRVCYRKC